MNTKATGLTILGILVLAVMVFALYTNAYTPRVDTATATSTQATSSQATATTSVPEPVYHTGDSVTVTARIGQAVKAIGETITPIRVVDDSRCPRDVQCVWAGTVHVSIQIVSGSGDSDMIIELGKTATTEVNSITLTGVTPAKNSTQEIASGDYVLTFTVTRR